MTGVTSDPSDPGLSKIGPDGMQETYLVLSGSERAKGFVRPLRRSYIHETCGAVTTMGVALAETYARDPKFYGSTYCANCKDHLAVSEFVWTEPRKDTPLGTADRVGS